MFVTIVAVMCLATMQSVCVEEIVTDSNMDNDLTFLGCMAHSQIGIADWKNKSPNYNTTRWLVDRIKCVPGHYEIKGRA